MDSMMSAAAPLSSVTATLWLIHWIGGTLWIVGAVLIVVWAVKHLSPEHLRSLGLWTFVIGILISVLTASAAAQGMQWLLAGEHGASMTSAGSTDSMMDGMMRTQGGTNSLEHQEHEQILQSLRQPAQTPSAPSGTNGR